MIKTKKDARALINKIDLFGFLNDVKHIKISFGSVDISRYDDFWIGHSNQKGSD